MQSDTYKLFPEIEPFQSGWYETSQGHEIYYEQCGNPDGKPVVFLHGGPGSGCNPMQRRFFDPAHYRIVLLDQRGCGRSKPQGSIALNTTRHLVDDLEGIRQLLNIEQWLVFGGSWGSTLALAYALTFPARVQGLILRGIFLSRASELNWFLKDVQQFYPEVWDKLIAYLPREEQCDVLNAYQTRIFSDDPSISIPAATNWNAYESSIMVLRPSTESGTPVADEIQLARARVQIHYIMNECFVDQFSLL
jgi:proline iminopeptidase